MEAYLFGLVTGFAIGAVGGYVLEHSRWVRAEVVRLRDRAAKLEDKVLVK